ncbi:MAG: hypothetical protein R6U20_11130 [Longimonas sp.]
MPARPVGFIFIMLCAAWMISASVPPSATAQSLDRLEETETSVAYYYHARPGDATVQISVWGTIGNTGIYEVPDDTQLDKLLTMAGGAPIDARQQGQDPDDIRITLYRTDDSGNRTVVYEEPLQDLVEDTRYPALQDDDILIVELEQARTPFRFRDILGIVSSLASLTLLGLRIFNRN